MENFSCQKVLLFSSPAQNGDDNLKHATATSAMIITIIIQLLPHIQNTI